MVSCICGPEWRNPNCDVHGDGRQECVQSPRLKCDLSISEHDTLIRCADADHRAALVRRAAGAPNWSPIERRHSEREGTRDYLDGKPIHCGTGLELQAIEYRSDDYGEFALKLATGVRVRYELAWPPGGADRQIILHGSIGGHEFTATADSWMRFRWPETARKARP